MASILSQPGFCCCIRIHRRWCFNTIRFISSKPFAFLSNSHRRLRQRPVTKISALDVSRSFSQASFTVSQPPSDVLSGDAPIPEVASKGFCGETEEEHVDTLSLIKAIGYDMAYIFAYSMREKTHAHRSYSDDVPEEVKQRRLNELIEAFHETTSQHYSSQVGTSQLVLVEGPNRGAPDTELIGKTDRGHRVSFVSLTLLDRNDQENNKRNPVVGDYVEVHVTKSTRASLFGEALAMTKLSTFYNDAEEAAVACGSSRS